MASVNKSRLGKALLALGLSGALVLGGSQLIAPQEGEVHGTYLDSAGIVTSCFGHTGKELRLGQKFTHEQCDEQFAEDLIKHDEEMLQFIKVPFISDYEHAAVLSFCYNVGVSSCSKSTLFRKLNEGDHIAACKQLAKWVYVQGKDCRLKESNCGMIS